MQKLDCSKCKWATSDTCRICRAQQDESKDSDYDEGLAIGYKLGYQMGQIEEKNRALCSQPPSLVDLQVEDILNREIEP